MNAQALIQDRYSLTDFEQLVRFIEQLLSVYTGAVVALFILIAAIAACRAIFDLKQSKGRERSAVGSHRKPAQRELKERPQCRSGLESMSLDQSSAY